MNVTLLACCSALSKDLKLSLFYSKFVAMVNDNNVSIVEENTCEWRDVPCGRGKAAGAVWSALLNSDEEMMDDGGNNGLWDGDSGCGGWPCGQPSLPLMVVPPFPLGGNYSEVPWVDTTTATSVAGLQRGSGLALSGTDAGLCCSGSSLPNGQLFTNNDMMRFIDGIDSAVLNSYYELMARYGRSVLVDGLQTMFGGSRTIAESFVSLIVYRHGYG